MRSKSGPASLGVSHSQPLHRGWLLWWLTTCAHTGAAYVAEGSDFIFVAVPPTFHLSCHACQTSIADVEMWRRISRARGTDPVAIARKLCANWLSPVQSAATAENLGASFSPNPRLDALTGLRWFAAFGVFLFHARSFYPLPHSIDLAYFGNSGVTFFFILSGFVLTWSFTPPDTAGKFYWRRFARIWPALAVSTAVAIPVSGALTAVALAIVVMWYSRTHLDFLAAAGLGGLLDDAANQILTPLYALLIAAVALRDLSGRHMVLQARPLVLLGQWFYSFYLMHATVLYAVAALWIPRQRPAWSNIWLATMTLGISILAAATVYYLVEHPAERALRRRLKAWPFVTAAAALPAGMAAVVSTTDSAVTAPELSDPVADAEAVITEAAARHAPHRDDQRSDPVGPI